MLQNKFKPYPDLTPVMEELKERKEQQEAEKAALFEKWLQQLEIINAEMRKLEKIEMFSQAVCGE